MNPRDLNFPQASKSFLALNAHVLGGAGQIGLPKIPKPKTGLMPQPLPVVVDAGPCRFTIPGAPMGKPRMTQRDKWAKRPAVLRYRAWADSARAAAPADMPKTPVRVDWIAFIAMPASWSKKRKLAMEGKDHQAKPDRDNIDKAVLDSLWAQDSCVAKGLIEKRWCWAGEERIEITITP